MTDSLFIFVPLAAAAIIASYTTWILLQRPHRRQGYQIDLPAGIGVDDLGLIERDLENLTTVIVIADKVERPASKLSDAVERNFARGVKYLFLISADRAAQEVDGYYMLFEALAKIALKRRQDTSSKCLIDLIEIKQLPYNWDDYPYIFYQVQLPSGKIKTLAFRGDQLHEGIARHYGRVDPAYAHTIARAIREEAPKSLILPNMDRDQFEMGSAGRVLQFANQEKVQ